MEKISEVIIEKPNIEIPSAQGVSAKTLLFAHSDTDFIVINVIDPKRFVDGAAFEAFSDVEPNYSFREVVAVSNFGKRILSQNFGQLTGPFLTHNMVDVA